MGYLLWLVVAVIILQELEAGSAEEPAGGILLPKLVLEIYNESSSVRGSENSSGSLDACVLSAQIPSVYAGRL